jgi:hypothetical protein
LHNAGWNKRSSLVFEPCIDDDEDCINKKDGDIGMDFDSSPLPTYPNLHLSIIGFWACFGIKRARINDADGDEVGRSLKNTTRIKEKNRDLTW